MTYAPGWDCDMHCVRSSAHLRATAPTPAACANSRFQSTLPLRGATAEQLLRLQTNSFQSTLPLRGATRHRVLRPCPGCYFNPHSPCGERLAYTYATPSLIWTLFQSTLPLRGATRIPRLSGQMIGDFNPHSPCGERRHWRRFQFVRGLLFQSTLPLRGATRGFDCPIRA